MLKYVKRIWLFLFDELEIGSLVRIILLGFLRMIFVIFVEGDKFVILMLMRSLDFVM